MPIAYTRSFQHTDWVDNVDRVQAGGDSGFNGRFHGLEAEFDALSGVVTQVNTGINTINTDIVAIKAQLAALGQVVQAPVTIGLLPAMVPFNPGAPQTNWSLINWSATVAAQPAGTFVRLQLGMTGADGVLPLALPNGVKMSNLTVLGSSNTGVMTTDLVQELRAQPYTRTTLTTVNGFASAAIANAPVVNSSIYLYYIHAYIVGNAQDVQLRGFQITYQP